MLINMQESYSLLMPLSSLGELRFHFGDVPLAGLGKTETSDIRRHLRDYRLLDSGVDPVGLFYGFRWCN